MLVRIASAAAALALMSGVAMAQSTAPQSTTPEAGAPADSSAAPADPAAAATPAPADTGTATDTAGRASSLAPHAAALRHGDPNVTSNPPVADTAENRAAFPPLSNAGRRSTPKGN
jgi:hypothetical protein